MRWALAILFSLNAILFLWILFGPAQQGQENRSREHLPDFGDIPLLAEVISDKPEEAGKAPTSPLSGATVREASQDDSAAPLEKKFPPVVDSGEGSVISRQAVSTGVSEQVEPLLSLSSSDYCGELGPFPSRNMAEGFRSKLAKDSRTQVGIESRKGKVDVGYWVMIPPLASVKEAEAMYKKLREAGFEDLWLMRKGEHANGISMGLYTEERYARRHSNNIRKKGFETVIFPKQKKARLYWVVFSGLGQDALEALEKDKLPKNAILRKKNCTRASAEN